MSVTTAKIADLNVTGAKIADATITNAKITSLDAAKITTGYLSASRLDATVAYISATAMIADAIITNAKISSLDASKITTGYLNAARLDTSVAYISQTAMIADLVVTTPKLAALLGINSASIPVLNPREYAKACTSTKQVPTKTCDWQTIDDIWIFDALSTVKHQLTECTVDVRMIVDVGATSGQAKFKVEYSINGGSSWIQFGSTYDFGSHSGGYDSGYVTITFTDSVTTELNISLQVRLRVWMYISGTEGPLVLETYAKNWSLSKRAFLAQRTNI